MCAAAGAGAGLWTVHARVRPLLPSHTSAAGELLGVLLSAAIPLPLQGAAAHQRMPCLRTRGAIQQQVVQVAPLRIEHAGVLRCGAWSLQRQHIRSHDALSVAAGMKPGRSRQRRHGC